ncbi:hypothetical protein ACFPZ0_18345 [Streptomonospora nanhaiensis]|uniref:RanBP2-type domain-containing protein n=1 Tax=Streptomonospora nanhaiensis TaxID=1323731 RepID=A0A853BFJ2_9ACTN|nr:hypothetical protein [Streptomonospora nanhaiensis]MBV2366277.1 hypothetical protein [Streptomonospora nanhaiensis]MBX9390358.1 hypothetical protein [Streptomonospora nanhaiensis]NYI93800.1 hypothetical protein [Streptomonospora nanhaiensis]
MADTDGPVKESPDPGPWTCRLCERPSRTDPCGYCGNPRSENANLPPLPQERPARVRPYLRP